jgi:archaellum biogenesis protein FlaJ (TadC family)
MFPSVLREMADILKAGGTYEYALREIKNSDYGPISSYFEKIVRKIDEGGTLEESLFAFSAEIDSKIIKRTMTIIVDSIKAGAKLSQVLEEISEDARSIYKLGIERKTQTMLQTAFLVAAGTFVAPVIFGLVGTIVSVLLKSSTGLVYDSLVIEQAIQSRVFILDLFIIYIFISNVSVGLMVSLMREGTINKSFFIIPILLLISYTVYYVSTMFSANMLGV